MYRKTTLKLSAEKTLDNQRILKRSTHIALFIAYVYVTPVR